MNELDRELKERPGSWIERNGEVVRKKDLEPGDSIQVKTKTSCLFTVFRPSRPAGMSPLAYYRKFKMVDDRYTVCHQGKYYCNPAHCSRSWKSKKERDAHLEGAYGMLG